MNSILKATTLSFILLAACSAPDKKSELEALKKQRDGLNEKIAMLETELKKEGGDTSATKASLVEISQLKANPFLTYIDVQGKVDADENISISSEIPGTVTRIYAKVGNEVNAGDVLVGDKSNATYTITSIDTNPLKSVLIVTTPNPIAAEPDDEFGFSETIIQFPNTL